MRKASIWGDRLARIASMDRSEVFDRLGQYLNARADLLRYRSGNNFARVPQAEELGEGRFFFESAEVPSICNRLKQALPLLADDLVSRANKICSHRFDMLGFEGLEYGAEIDWHFDAVHGKRAPRKPWFKINYLDFEEVGDSKITWELNRHQHFVTLAKAYWLTGDDKYAHEIFAQWTRWHEENPYPIGINWASSLEVAFRTMSWVWTFFLVKECPLFSPELRRQWNSALRLNGRHIETYLSTYFSPNTHLLGEALALFSLGVVFPSMQGAMRWRQRGWEILQREAAKQVRPDGFYFEQSTYYHVYALDIFLHARILAELNRVPIPIGFDQIVQRMLNALLLLGRSGVPPMSGDDDGGRLFDPRRNRSEHMLDPLATGAILYQRGDLKAAAGYPREETLWLLGKKGLDRFDSLPSSATSPSSTALFDGGLYLMSYEDARQQLLIDAGPLGALNGGHAHANALSICLVRNGRHLLIDPGTGEYVGLSGERARLRGTGAHNTLQVDGFDQADGSGPFSWRNPPAVKVELWITGKRFDLFQGSHDGYSRLSSPVIHRRWVFHKKREFYMVCDRAEGSGPHQLDIAWHLDPSLSPGSHNSSVFESEGTRLMVLTADSRGWSRSVQQDYCWPVYGQKERASVVHCTASVNLPADFATVLIADEPPEADPGRLVRIDDFAGAAVCAYRYSTLQREHSFCFAQQSGAWELGALASDANFLSWSFDRVSKECTLVLCNGSYVAVGGRRVLTYDRSVSYAEVSSSDLKSELFPSRPAHLLLLESLDGIWSDADPAVRGGDPKEMGI